MAAEGLDPTLQKMLKIIQEIARDGWGREHMNLINVNLSSFNLCWEFFLKSSERKLNMISHFFVSNGVH